MTHTGSGPTAPTDPRTIRLRCPDDVLAAVPVLLGFAPADSVVLLSAGAERAFHARIDLPPREALPTLVSALVEPTVRQRPDAVLLALYSDDAAKARRAWHALRDGFDEAGVYVADAMRVESHRYYPYLAGDPRLRRDGIAYDVSAHPFLVEAVLAGKVLRPSRADLVASIDPDPAAIPPVAALLAGHRPGEPPDDPRETAWVAAVTARHAGAGTAPTDAEVARLAVAMRSERLRDAARCPVTRRSADAHVELWRGVVRRTPASDVAGPAALLAWNAWLAGDGALAWAATDRCRAAEPTHPLGDLVARFLTHAVPPGVFSPDDLPWASPGAGSGRSCRPGGDLH